MELYKGLFVFLIYFVGFFFLFFLCFVNGFMLFDNEIVIIIFYVFEINVNRVEVICKIVFLIFKLCK